jgi:hypothetical protein
MRVRMILYDEETGKVLYETDKAIFIGRKPFIDRDFVKIFVAFFRDVLENERLGKGAWRLLLYAIENLEYNSLQVTIVPQKAMADLDVSEATFYRWLKVLLEEDFLEKIATNVYKLKPNIAIKGQMRKVPDLGFFDKP